jgi:hypothetical protein
MTDINILLLAMPTPRINRLTAAIPTISCSELKG